MRKIKTSMLASVLVAGCAISAQAKAEVNVGFKYEHTKYSESGIGYSGNIKLNQYYATLGASNEFSEAYLALGAANLKTSYNDESISLQASESGLLYGVGTRLFTELDSGLRPSIDVFYSINDFDSMDLYSFDVVPEMGYVINLQNDMQLIPSAGVKFQHIKVTSNKFGDLEGSDSQTSGVVSLTLNALSVPVFARLGASFGSDMDTVSFQINYGF